VKLVNIHTDGLEWSFFLNIGQILAVFQSSGKQAWSNDAWKSNVRTGVMAKAISFERRVGILSGPDAL